MAYVIVSTNLRIDHVGGVWGPVETKKQAEALIEELNFPTPEEVLIRELQPVSNEVLYEVQRRILKEALNQ